MPAEAGRERRGDTPPRAEPASETVLSIPSLVTLAICAALLWTGLGERGLEGDEAIYASVADFAERRGDWAPLRAGETPYVSKPPLAIWVIGLGIRLFGHGEAALRAGAAGAAWLLCLATLRWGTRIASPAAGSLAALVLVTAPNLLHLHGLRAAVTEPWLLLTITTSFWLAWSGSGRTRLLGLALLSVANGLTKGVYGLVVVAGALALTRTLRAVGERRAPETDPAAASDRMPALLGAVLVPGATAYLGWLRYSLDSWREVGSHLGYDIVERSLRGVDPGHLNSPGIYAGSLWIDFGLLAVVAAVALVADLGFRRRAPGAGLEGRALLGSWIAVVLGLALASRSRLAWYVYPAYPAMALSAGAGLVGIWSRARGRPWVRAALAAALVAVLAGRARGLAEAWPKPDRHSLARLARIVTNDPRARAFVDERLLRGGAAGGRVRQWNAFYLRRFERVRPGELPGSEADCRFLVTAQPELWQSLPMAAQPQQVELRRAAEGDLRLIVLDFCEGRFADGEAAAARNDEARPRPGPRAHWAV